MDLLPFCNRQNRLPLREVIRIISSSALALDYAYRNGVIHRDIKPGNIRILKNGTVKVIDFGVARIVETSTTQDGALFGSPSYMSPEQINGERLDGRSDLFSLGVIFYELLTGRKPFDADDLYGLLLEIKSGDPILLHGLVPELPRGCVAIVEKCLAKKREDRYANGKELVDALSDFVRKRRSSSPA